MYNLMVLMVDRYCKNRISNSMMRESRSLERVSLSALECISDRKEASPQLRLTDLA